MVRKKGQLSLPKLVFQDQRLLVINKPFSWTVLYGSGQKTPLQCWLEKKAWFKKGRGVFKQRSGIVHRLDKDTSGLLLVAKDLQMFESLQKAFASRQIKKEYLALVKGKIPQKGAINAPIQRMRGKGRKWRVFPQGRESITNYVRETTYHFQAKDYSLIRVEPLTGRTHQIRVHFKYLGFPLAGDPLYGGRNQFKIFSRLFLHASKLSFIHPATKKNRTINSSLPARLKAILTEIDAQN